MRSFKISALLVTAFFILVGCNLQAEDKNLLAALFGEKKAKPARTSSPGKRVEIDLTKQQLKAYQGNRVVMRTNISSGKNGGTPTGNFRAGPYKSETHFSSRYHNAPMPWSVQISGHIFAHGSSHVPNYPASHGCVRLPLTGRNAAKRFYKWCDVGTPIRIYYSGR